MEFLKIDVSFSLSYGGKFADLQFADWLTQEICGFAICGIIKRNLRNWNLRTRISQKFADLLVLIEPKNFADLRTFKITFACPPLHLKDMKTIISGTESSWIGCTNSPRTLYIQHCRKKGIGPEMPRQLPAITDQQSIYVLYVDS